MRYLKIFEDYNKDGILIIVDVQKSFKKFFTDNYITALNKYCDNFKDVYQIWDNHIDGKNVDKDYLYDENPDIPVHNDLYSFPNQRDMIEKRYNYDVDADFYKKILDEKVFNDIKQKEDNHQLKRGDFFKTTEDTYLIYIGNNHKWYHLPKKLQELFTDLKGKEVVMVGGSDQECYLDVETAAKTFGVKIRRDNNYIYSATYCPIK
jgi:hypothetical protein